MQCDKSKSKQSIAQIEMSESINIDWQSFVIFVNHLIYTEY